MVDSTARPQPFLGLEGPLAIAHRGGGAERPENTMAAFEHAVDLGYRCIETDVRATRDGVVVVYHDEQLDRLTGHAGPLAAHSWRELAELRVRGAEPIARLDEMLAAWPDPTLHYRSQVRRCRRTAYRGAAPRQRPAARLRRLVLQSPIALDPYRRTRLHVVRPA